MRGRLVAASALCVAVLMTTGCVPVLPTWDTVRQEARSAMQSVVDVLPRGTVVEDRSTETPFECSGDGAVYTGHLVAVPAEEFDEREFLAELPVELGEGWEVDERAILPAGPATNVESRLVSLSVAALRDDDGSLAVDILAISRCGEMPAE